MSCSRRTSFNRAIRRSSWIAAGLTLVIMVIGLRCGAAQAVAPASSAKSAPSLARYLPGEKLVALFEFGGIDAHGDAWKKTAAQKALNDTPLGALLRDLAGQGVDFAHQQNPALRRMSKADLALLFDQITHKGFAAGFFLEDDQPRGIVVFRDADKPEIVRLIEAAVDAGRPQGAPGPTRWKRPALDPFLRPGIGLVDRGPRRGPRRTEERRRRARGPRRQDAERRGASQTAPPWRRPTAATSPPRTAFSTSPPCPPCPPRR